MSTARQQMTEAVQTAIEDFRVRGHVCTPAEIRTLERLAERIFGVGRASTTSEPYQGAGEPRHCAHEPVGFGHCGHLGCPNSISRCAVHSTPPPYREA